MVWWVIDVSAGGRFNPDSVRKVHQLCSDDAIPVIMVLNKCDYDAQIVEHVEKEVREHCLAARGVILVVADPRGPMKLLCESCFSAEDVSLRPKKKDYRCDNCDGGYVSFKPSYGVDMLIQMTVGLLPDIVAKLVCN